METQLINDIISSGSTENPGTGYSGFLKECGIAFSYEAPYLSAKNSNEPVKWCIHISIIRQQFHLLIRPLLDLLVSRQSSFLVPINADLHSSILDGRSGFELTGKVITVCAPDDDEALLIAGQLMALTQDLIGPAIPFAYHLSTCVAVSYCSLSQFNPSYTVKDNIFYFETAGSDLQQVLKANKISWPFDMIKAFQTRKQPRLINRQYIPLSTLKSEPKGNVIKALKVNPVYNMQYAVLKQGRRYQSFDNHGRDALDRLKWQYHQQRLLHDKAVVPHVFEYFELRGDGFLAMEYIEGISLGEKAVQLSEGQVWRFMPVDKKRELIGYVLQVIDILAVFHEAGIVHRDVTPSNFMIIGDEKVIAIDIELSCDLPAGLPSPPFSLGTPGYMSPGQEQASPPSFKDDIYGLGAMLISLLTGVLPNKFNTGSVIFLTNALDYFIESGSLVTVIASCVHSVPELRPGLEEISHAISMYDALLLTNCLDDEYLSSAPSEFHNLIGTALRTLMSSLISGKIAAAGSVMNPPGQGTIAEQTGYLPVDKNSMTAIFMVITKAKQLGYSVPETKHLLAYVEFYANQNFKNAHAPVDPLDEIQFWGALAGLTGLPLDENMIMPPDTFADKISLTGKPFGVSGGLAGDGLVILSLSGSGCHTYFMPRLMAVINLLLEQQQADGSWYISAGAANHADKVTGFFHGIAGIVCFLLEYYTRLPSPGLRERIMLALDWLKKQRIINLGKTVWPVSGNNTIVDPWLEHGFSGVALVFIKAYEILREEDYQVIASEVLRNHPEHMAGNYCAFSNGLAGLGEIYLEAYRVFGYREWRQRAQNIADTLENSCFQNHHGNCYWLDGTQLEPTPDFLTGNSGILHFLLRNCHPDKLIFPFSRIK